MSAALTRYQEPVPLREIAPGHYEAPAIHINIVIQLDAATMLALQRQQLEHQKAWAQYDLDMVRYNHSLLERRHLREEERLEIERERLAVEKEKVAVLKSIDAKLERLFWAQG